METHLPMDLKRLTDLLKGFQMETRKLTGILKPMEKLKEIQMPKGKLKLTEIPKLTEILKVIQMGNQMPMGK